MNYTDLTQKKNKLDQYRPLSPALVKNLEQWFLIELTYSSNAIEGNTLSRKETAAVVEKGLTIGGKSVIEHLEATNHAEALNMIMDVSQGESKDIEEHDLLILHGIILRGIDHEYGGKYRPIPVRISGSDVALPDPLCVPDLMREFVDWLRCSSAQLHPVELAAEAHYRFVTIHPFTDGNGRTARLLMNLILLQSGYPPALIRPEDRMEYINGLEKAQLGGSQDDYKRVIIAAIARSFDVYLEAVGETVKDVEAVDYKLLKIGQLGKRTGENNSTIRFWTKQGLLEVADITPSGYQLYAQDMIQRVYKIRELQEQRYTIQEIERLLKP